MTTVKGVVKKLMKFGKNYSVLLVTDEAPDGVFYGWGFKPIEGVAVGNTIQFVAIANGKYWNADVKTLEILDASTNEAAPTKTDYNKQWKESVVNTPVKGGVSRDTYWEEKAKKDLNTQKEIRLQASRNAAIAFVKVALDSGSLDLPKKLSDKLGAIEDLVKEYTNTWYQETKDVGEGKECGSCGEPSEDKEDNDTGVSEDYE